MVKNILFFGEKKGWIRIVEAFLAVLLVLGVLLVIFSKQQVVSVDENQIISSFLSSTLLTIKQNEVLRSEILSNNITGVNERLSKLVPAGYNFSSRICSYSDNCYIESPAVNVYSDDALFAANLTYYDSQNATKLKISMWKI